MHKNRRQPSPAGVRYECSGGPVRRDHALYVKRSADQTFQSALEKKRDVFVITAPRQTGKTSLWLNAANDLQAQGYKTGSLDFRVPFGHPEENTRSSRGWTETLLRAATRIFKL